MKTFYKYFMHIVWSFDCYFQILCARIFQSTKLCLIKAFEDNSNALVVWMRSKFTEKSFLNFTLAILRLEMKDESWFHNFSPIINCNNKIWVTMIVDQTYYLAIGKSQES